MAERRRREARGDDACALRDRLAREAAGLARHLASSGGDPTRCRPDGAGLGAELDHLHRRRVALEERIGRLEARAAEAVQRRERARARRLDAEARADLAARRLKSVAGLVRDRPARPRGRGKP